MKIYTQCLLKKNNQFQTAWIEQKYANLNKILKIRINGIWDNNWIVITSYSSLNDYDSNIQNQQYKHTREVSDI
jgi:hypothetical protein